MDNMDDDGFAVSDFSIEGMSAEKVIGCHGELPARYKDGVTIEVLSAKGLVWYEVLHDGTNVLYCDCPWAQYHYGQCAKHWPRAQAVLDRRKARQHAQAVAAQDSARWENSSLNGANRGFSMKRR